MNEVPVDLSHDDCLELLANPSTQTILEKFGYEFSNRGLSEFRKNRPNIVPALVRAVITELERHPIFPPEHGISPPEVGIFIRKQEQDFIFMDIDKPSVWVKKTFSTAEGAARHFIRSRFDAYWLDSDVSRDEGPKSVEFSWLPGEFDQRFKPELET